MYVEGTSLIPRSGSVSDQTTTQGRFCYSVNGGSPILDSFFTNFSNRQVVTWFEGADCQNYHARVRKGELMPFTPWKKYVEIYTPIEGVYDYTVRTANTYRYFLTPETVPFFPAWSVWQLPENYVSSKAPSDTLQLVTKAAAKVYGQGFDALTWLAELKDVRRLWSSISNKLLLLRDSKYLQKSLRSLGLKPLKGVKDTASQWLEYRYGWSQLVRDFKDLNEAISIAKLARNRFSARCSDKQSYSVTTTEGGWGGQWLNMQKICTDSWTISCRGSVVADIELPVFQFNLLQTGWEVIPFSFVVDWFVNVGRCLSAISFLVKAKAYAASHGYSITLDRDWRFVTLNGKPGYVSGETSTHCHVHAEYEVRHPCQVPYFPHLAVNMNTTKLLDAVALIVQRLK